MSQINIPIGSGYLYAVEYAGSIPDTAAIETEANRLGYIQSGASIKYAPTYQRFKCISGKVFFTLVDEDVTMDFGLIAWDYDRMDAICATAEITEADGVRTVKIGGNRRRKQFLFRFVHPDAIMGDVRVTITGKNTGGFTLAYKPDDAASLAPSIAAESLDSTGTLLIFEESLPA